jgi:hypothetical protein
MTRTTDTVRLVDEHGRLIGVVSRALYEDQTSVAAAIRNLLDERMSQDLARERHHHNIDKENIKVPNYDDDVPMKNTTESPFSQARNFVKEQLRYATAEYEDAQKQQALARERMDRCQYELERLGRAFDILNGEQAMEGINMAAEKAYR